AGSSTEALAKLQSSRWHAFVSSTVATASASQGMLEKAISDATEFIFAPCIWQKLHRHILGQRVSLALDAPAKLLCIPLL
ncbi:hypothetical protein KJJ97_27435, partial [Escherichia coli]|uniref:hypothetical protein n=1 Tax=Escherichia coli TaxID=562 RepID=UPI001BD948A6